MFSRRSCLVSIECQKNLRDFVHRALIARKTWGLGGELTAIAGLEYRGITISKDELVFNNLEVIASTELHKIPIG